MLYNNVRSFSPGFISCFLSCFISCFHIMLSPISLPSPRGHYFATASHDRTARLWSTDHPQPLRIFAGHVSDVNVRAYLLCLHLFRYLRLTMDICLKLHEVKRISNLRVKIQIIVRLEPELFSRFLYYHCTNLD